MSTHQYVLSCPTHQKQNQVTVLTHPQALTTGRRRGRRQPARPPAPSRRSPRAPQRLPRHTAVPPIAARSPQAPPLPLPDPACEATDGIAAAQNFMVSITKPLGDALQKKGNHESLTARTITQPGLHDALDAPAAACQHCSAWPPVLSACPQAALPGAWPQRLLPSPRPQPWSADNIPLEPKLHRPWTLGRDICSPHALLWHCRLQGAEQQLLSARTCAF